MRQHSASKSERRADPRESRAFSFWFRPFRSRQRTSAWMLDVSAGGAAFLVAAKDAPAIGRRIELIEMQTPHRIVREEANPLPMYARVLRHDNPGSETLRVAVRFEADTESPLKVSKQRADTIVCPQTPLIPSPQPPETMPVEPFPPSHARILAAPTSEAN